MKIHRYIIVFVIVSCGGGSGDSSFADNESYPSITSFNSSDSSIYINDSISLSWISINTSSCIASGDWNGNKNTSGTQTITLSEIKNYTFRVS